MKYIICAFNGEARPFIEYFKLQRIRDLPYPLYKGENILLVITHIGYENALMVTSSLMGYRVPDANDIIINIGVCATPKTFKIGDLLLINKISYKDHDISIDIPFKHQFSESALKSIDSIQNTFHSVPVDMESYAIFKATKQFIKRDQILFIKIVSDHFNPDSTTKGEMINLIRKHVLNINELITKK